MTARLSSVGAMIFVPSSDLGDYPSSWEVSGPQAHDLHHKGGETEAPRGSDADVGWWKLS